MKSVIPFLIAPNHNSFISGHQLQDNVIIFQEVLYSMQTKKTSAKWMVLKINVEEAYDKLIWDFLLETLTQA